MFDFKSVQIYDSAYFFDLDLLDRRKSFNFSNCMMNIFGKERKVELTETLFFN